MPQNDIRNKLDAITGKRSSLTFRAQKEQDKITDDVYYKFAPGWSTLAFSSSRNGIKPEVKLNPTQIVEALFAVQPHVTGMGPITIKWINGANQKDEVSREWVVAVNMFTKDVPNLYTSQVNWPDRIIHLENQIGVLASELAKLRDSVRAEPHTGVGHKRPRLDSD